MDHHTPVDYDAYRLASQYFAVRSGPTAEVTQGADGLEIREGEPVLAPDERELARIFGAAELTAGTVGSDEDSITPAEVLSALTTFIVTDQRLIGMAVAGSSFLGTIDQGSEVHTFAWPLRLVDCVAMPTRARLSDRLAGGRRIELMAANTWSVLRLVPRKVELVSGAAGSLDDRTAFNLLVGAIAQAHLPHAGTYRAQLKKLLAGEIPTRDGEFVAQLVADDDHQPSTAEQAPAVRGSSDAETPTPPHVAWTDGVPALRWTVYAAPARPPAEGVCRSPLTPSTADDWTPRWPSVETAQAWTCFNLDVRTEDQTVVVSGSLERPNVAVLGVNEQDLTIRVAHGRARQHPEAGNAIVDLPDGDDELIIRWPLADIGAIQYQQRLGPHGWTDDHLLILGRGLTPESAGRLAIRGAHYCGSAPDPHPDSGALDGIAGVTGEAAARAQQLDALWSPPPGSEKSQQAAGVRTWNLVLPGGPTLMHADAGRRGSGLLGEALDVALDLFP